MSKHTPGPWSYAADSLKDGRYSIYHNGPIAYCGDTTARDGDGEANARLIAAAPEMLAELRRLRKDPRLSPTEVEAMTQVINKATGQD
jgi:hypothetical protein